MTAIDHLADQRDQLAALADQLGGSELEDAPSVRLLTAALQERLEKLEEKLDEARRCELTVQLDGATGGIDARATAAIVGTVATAVADAVVALLPDLSPRATSDAARLSLTGLDLTADGGSVVLTSPPRSADQLLVDPASGQPVLEAALSAVCDDLEVDGGPTLGQLGAAVAEEPVSIRVHLRTPAGEREVALPRARLQAAAVTG